MFGYPTLPMNSTLQRHPGSIYGGAGTLPPVPLPRLNLQVGKYIFFAFFNIRVFLRVHVRVSICQARFVSDS